MKHELKTWPEYFQPVLDGRKPFEVRRNDRNFQVGDELILKEWMPLIAVTHFSHTSNAKKAEELAYTGREVKVRVTFVMTADDIAPFGRGWDGPPLQDGYVVMGICLIERWDGIPCGGELD